MKKCQSDPFSQRKVLAQNIHTFCIDLDPFLLSVIEALDKHFFQAAGYSIAPRRTLIVGLEFLVIFELLGYMIGLVEML